MRAGWKDPVVMAHDDRRFECVAMVRGARDDGLPHVPFKNLPPGHIDHSVRTAGNGRAATDASAFIHLGIFRNRLLDGRKPDKG